MEFIQFTPETKQLEIVKKDLPDEIPSDSILVEVAFTGVSKNDLKILSSKIMWQPTEKCVLGYEVSGYVAKIGEKVSRLSVGDRVVVEPARFCNCCKNCQSNMQFYCTHKRYKHPLGFFDRGAWTNYLVCKERNAYELPDGLSLEQAIFTAKMVPIIEGLKIIESHNLIQRIILCGAAILGMTWMCVLNYKNYEHVTVVDPERKRLKLIANIAKRNNPNHHYQFVTPNELDKLLVKKPDDLYDVVIDTTGTKTAIEQGIKGLDFGGYLLLTSIANVEDRFQMMPQEVFYKELRIFGVNYNPHTFQHSLDFLATIADRYLQMDLLGAKVFNFADYQQGISQMEAKLITKAVFKFDSLKFPLRCNCSDLSSQSGTEVTYQF